MNPQSSLRDLKLSPGRRLPGRGRLGITGAAAEHCPDWGIGGLFQRSALLAAVLALSCSLIMTGGLIWIDNTWAVVGDNDPATSIEISIMFAALGGDLADLDPDGDGQIPLTGGKLLKGDGGHDDNKQEPNTIGYQSRNPAEAGFSDAPVLPSEGNEATVAEDVSRCPADVVPIQIFTNGWLYKWEEVTTLAGLKTSGGPPGFRTFVTAVTEHVAAKLAQENICTDTAEIRERSLLQFVPMDISYYKASPIPPLFPNPLFRASSSGACRISSPWIELIIERKPVPLVRGFVRYNERQLLTDQALLDGASIAHVPTGMAIPMHAQDFLNYAAEYEMLEVTTLRPPKLKLMDPIENHVPPDLLWLFRRSTHSTFSLPGDFQAKAMEMGAKGYTQVVIILIDRCFESFESGGAELSYDNILDIDDPALLEQYKIVKPGR